MPPPTRPTSLDGVGPSLELRCYHLPPTRVAASSSLFPSRSLDPRLLHGSTAMQASSWPILLHRPCFTGQLGPKIGLAGRAVLARPHRAVGPLPIYIVESMGPGVSGSKQSKARKMFFFKKMQSKARQKPRTTTRHSPRTQPRQASRLCSPSEPSPFDRSGDGHQPHCDSVIDACLPALAGAVWFVSCQSYLVSEVSRGTCSSTRKWV
jgi:hypothetical protein